MKRTSSQFGRARSEESQALAEQALLFLAADHERLGDFLAVTGSDPASLRKEMGSPAFIRGMLGYMASDEALLISFSASIKRSPEEVGQLIASLDHPID